MANLFLIDGVPGSGKSRILQFFASKGDAKFIVKYTTKPLDADAFVREDLLYVSVEKYNALRTEEDFDYQYPLHSPQEVHYLIKKTTLDTYLHTYANVFIIVRSAEVIEQIRAAYDQYADINVIPVFLYCDREKLVERVKNQIKSIHPNVTQTELDSATSRRVSRTDECLHSYVESLQRGSVYQYVILNDLDEGEFISSMESIYSRYNPIAHSAYATIAFLHDGNAEDSKYSHKKLIAQAAAELGFSLKELKVSSDQSSEEIISMLKGASLSLIDVEDQLLGHYLWGVATGACQTIPSSYILTPSETRCALANSFVCYYRDANSLYQTVLRTLSNFKKEHFFNS